MLWTDTTLPLAFSFLVFLWLGLWSGLDDLDFGHLRLYVMTGNNN